MRVQMPAWPPLNDAGSWDPVWEKVAPPGCGPVHASSPLPQPAVHIPVPSYKYTYRLFCCPFPAQAGTACSFCQSSPLPAFAPIQVSSFSSLLTHPALLTSPTTRLPLSHNFPCLHDHSSYSPPRLVPAFQLHVSTSPMQVRRGFIRKVLGLLTAQLALTTAVSAAFVTSAPVGGGRSMVESGLQAEGGRA